MGWNTRLAIWLALVVVHCQVAIVYLDSGLRMALRTEELWAAAMLAAPMMAGAGRRARRWWAERQVPREPTLDELESAASRVRSGDVEAPEAHYGYRGDP